MDRIWYNEFNFPNADYIKYLHDLVNESEMIAEIPCSAKISSEFQYEPANPTFTSMRFMKHVSANAVKDDYYIWLTNHSFSNSIHYSLRDNEIEFFETRILDRHISSMWSGRLYHELVIFSQSEGHYKPFFHEVYSYLSDGEMLRPMRPRRRQPFTLCIEGRNWKRKLKKKIDQAIKTLIIRCPAVDKFKNHILRFGNLGVLDISCNKIVYIPMEFGNLQIRELYLANNSIGAYDNWKWLSGKNLCKYLRVLDLSNNQMKTCPITIGRLNLDVLDLSDNWLETIPPSIGRMHGLRCLKLARNFLRYVPEALFRIPLKFLDLSGNNLSELDDRLTNLPEDYQHIPALITYASNSMNKNHIYCREEIPEIIEKILDNITRCYCGKPADESLFHVCRVNCRRLFPVVVYQGPRVFGINIKFFCCSSSCYIALSQ